MGKVAAVKTLEKDGSPVSARPSSSVRTNSSCIQETASPGVGTAALGEGVEELRSWPAHVAIS